MSFGKRTKDILAANVAVSALVGDRITPLVREDKALPAIVYTVPSEIPEHVLSGDDLGTARTQVDCYSDRYGNANELADLVAEALSVKSNGLTSVMWSRTESREDETGLYRVMLEFMQWVTEA